MTVTIRILRSLYECAMNDLERQHPFAAERVGFLYGRVSEDEEAVRVFLMSYEPVPDRNYVRDDRVGARISADAIRSAMQHALSDGVATFHVHVHGHHGPPDFGDLDRRELARLIPSFLAVAPSVPHGGLVFSHDGGRAVAWKRDMAKPVDVSCISLVGFPLERWELS